MDENDNGFRESRAKTNPDANTAMVDDQLFETIGNALFEFGPIIIMHANKGNERP